MFSKFKLNDEVCLENTPDERLVITYIKGNMIHCTDNNNRQVIVDVTALIKFSTVENWDDSEGSLNW